MRWIPELSHSPAAGHRPWPSVQALSQPFKFQLCPQEWLQKPSAYFFIYHVYFPPLLTKFVNCSSHLPSAGPAWARALCPWQFLALISCAAPQAALPQTRLHLARIPHLYNFVWKEKTRQRAEPDHHHLLLDKSWTGLLQEQPESLE